MTTTSTPPGLGAAEWLTLRADVDGVDAERALQLALAELQAARAIKLRSRGLVTPWGRRPDDPVLAQLFDEVDGAGVRLDRFARQVRKAHGGCRGWVDDDDWVLTEAGGALLEEFERPAAELEDDRDRRDGQRTANAAWLGPGVLLLAAGGGLASGGEFGFTSYDASSRFGFEDGGGDNE